MAVDDVITHPTQEPTADALRSVIFDQASNLESFLAFVAPLVAIAREEACFKVDDTDAVGLASERLLALLRAVDIQFGELAKITTALYRSVGVNGSVTR